MIKYLLWEPPMTMMLKAQIDRINISCKSIFIVVNMDNDYMLINRSNINTNTIFIYKVNYIIGLQKNMINVLKIDKQHKFHVLRSA